MNVTLINTTDSGGGAAIACRRLLDALNSSEVNAQMLVKNKTLADNRIQSSVHNKLGKLRADIDFLYERISFVLKERDKSVRFAFSMANAGKDISGETVINNADLLHLHWFNAGFLSIKNIQQLIQLNKPIVWTLHDMWTFTGGCHYSGVCDYFMNECGNCYFLDKPSAADISHKGWIKKRNLFTQGSKITFIACSSWMQNMAYKSSLLQAFEIITIPNPINTETFSRQDKMASRIKWHVPLDTKVILFGAANINHTRKGIKYLIEALHKMKNLPGSFEQPIQLAVFGKSQGFDFSQIPFPVINLPVISSEAHLAEIYSLADVFVLPSLEDNLPNMIMEALSCSTPVAAFNTGGIRDMIDHGENGYLASFMDSDDLAAGILSILNAENDFLALNARKKVINNFSYSVVAQKHINLYERLLK